MSPTERSRSMLQRLRWLVLCVPMFVGCVSAGYDAIPAPRLAPEFRGTSRNCMVPVDFTRLRIQPPEVYTLGAGDVLGVFVQDILPASNEQRLNSPVVSSTPAISSEYYPAKGYIQMPVTGVPTEIQSNGAIELPHVAPLRVDGLTLHQAGELIRETYRKQEIVAPGKERVVLSMIRPRVHRILVIREDASPPPVLTRRDAYFVGKRGSAEVIDLPAHENDVLHALSATGGLPGEDAYNAVWIMRSRKTHDVEVEAIQSVVAAGADTRQLLKESRIERSHLRIPLRVCPTEQLTFNEADITLNDGDIVFLESRDHEVFYVGGYIPGAQIPLPRDYDLDILGAIAMATGSVAGPPGGGANTVFRSGSGPGNIIPPTRAIISRTLCDGRIIKIRVNVTKALSDPAERLIIQPNDIVMLQYTPGQASGNFLLNLFQFNVSFIPAN